MKKLKNIKKKNREIVKSESLPTTNKNFGPAFAGWRPVKGGFKLLVLTF